MKIAYLANVRFPSERAHAAQIAHNCEAFVQAGSEVDLYVTENANASELKVAEQFGFTPHFSVTTLPPQWLYPRYKISFYVREFIFAFAFFFRKRPGQYDIIYARSEWILWLLSFFVKSSQLVWESHEAKFNLAARRLLQKGVKVVVISQGIKKYYETHAVPAEQLLVAEDGIDDGFYAQVLDRSVAREKLGLDRDDFIAMYIGGFDVWKGIHTFFEAAQHAPDVRFVAIGGSESEIVVLHAQYPTVQFLGSKPYRELRNYQQAADVLVVPNTAKELLSSHYTSPLKLFAHMASGVPMVVTDIPSLISVVQSPQVTVCAPDNPIDMGNAIMEVRAHYEEKKSAAEDLKSSARKYTWKERASLIKSFLLREVS